MYRKIYMQYNSIGTNAIKQAKVVAEKSAEVTAGRLGRIKVEFSDPLHAKKERNLQEIIIPEVSESKV